jgi:hypothetical protein
LGDFLHDEGLFILGEVRQPFQGAAQAVQHIAQLAGGFGAGGGIPGHGHDQVLNGQTLLQGRVHDENGPLKGVVGDFLHFPTDVGVRVHDFFDVFARPPNLE